MTTSNVAYGLCAQACIMLLELQGNTYGWRPVLECGPARVLGLTSDEIAAIYSCPLDF
jgi:hypothetical protein